MSPSRHHAEWLSLVESSGPFLTLPVLLRVFPQELDVCPPDLLREWKLAYDEWEDNQDGKNPDPAIHNAWLRYVLQSALGFDVTETIIEGQAIPDALRIDVAAQVERISPDLVVRVPLGENEAGAPRLLISAYSRHQKLVEPVEGKAWIASPKQRMAELLRGTETKLGLITNGEQWMLVSNCSNTLGFASWHSSLWREEPLTFRAFISLVSQRRFFGVAPTDTIEAILKESADDQAEVTNQLGNQVLAAVEVLVQSIDRIDKDRGRQLLQGFDEKRLYEAALTTMMRLVFLFSAEERDLLLLGDELYDENYAVSTLRAQLREAADQHGEEVLERRCDAWSRLLATFRAVYGGVQHEAMRLPAYGGNLFNPDKYPFLEGREAGTNWRHTEARPLPIDNRTVLHLLDALQILQVKVPGGGPAEARRLSFRALDIEQIGHVYEGLLDHVAVRASGPMLGLQCVKGKDAVLPLAQLEEMREGNSADLIKFLQEATGRGVPALTKSFGAGVGLDDVMPLHIACGNDPALYARVAPFAGLLRRETFGKPLVITAGSVYVSKGTDRRSSGTHYTPRSLTEPIVKRTLDPLLYAGMADGVPPSPETLRTPKEILSLKICDMTVGSGAFLVQGCRYLSERLVEAWEREEKAHPGLVLKTPEGEFSVGSPAERLLPENREERLTIARRLVVDRCLYGVDKNPMAVEMAKLSLWLITLEKERPFTFLDHAIKCGDSLVGVSLDQLYSWSLTPKPKADTTYSFLEMLLKDDIETALSHRKDIALLREETIADIQQKERLLAAADRAIDHARLSADLIVSPSFTDDKPKEQEKRRNDFQHRFTSLGKTEASKELRQQANAMLGEVTPFHWPLEFPEVFAKERGGFDAIVGNPPFMGGQKITGEFGVPFREYLVNVLGCGKKGSADIVAYFYLRAIGLLRQNGSFGLIATNTIAQGDTREVGLEQILDAGGTIIDALPSQKWPGVANLEVAVVIVRLGEWNTDRQLSGIRTGFISPFLDDGSSSGKPFRLKANEGKAFQGSIVLGMGFVLEPAEAQALIARDQRNAEVVFPYLNGEDLNSRPDQSPSRWVINFADMLIDDARSYDDCFEIVYSRVRPERMEYTPTNSWNKGVREKWWLFGAWRKGLAAAIAGLERVLAVSLVNNHLGFAFCPSSQVFAHRLAVFPMSTFEQFAILQSHLHYHWAWKNSSTLRRDINYSPSDCVETFPFPYTAGNVHDLASIGEQYYTCRSMIMKDRQIGLTGSYNLFHSPDTTSEDVKDFRIRQVELDYTVLASYGWEDMDLGHGFYDIPRRGVRFTFAPSAEQEVLRRLLKLNHERATEEAAEAARMAEEAKALKAATRGRKPKANRVAEGQITTDDLSDAPTHLSIPAPHAVSNTDIEPAILTWLIGREASPDIVERYLPKSVKLRPFRQSVRLLRSVRLAKELYGIQEMVGVPIGATFERQTWGPLSTTFYEAVREAENRGWLIRETDVTSASDIYGIGPNAAEAIELAAKVIGDHAQAAEDMLYYVEGDVTIEGERQTTVHKAWADLKAYGIQATRDEVYAEVQRWKPNRTGFSKQEVWAALIDLENRGLLVRQKDTEAPALSESTGRATAPKVSKDPQVFPWDGRETFVRDVIPQLIALHPGMLLDFYRYAARFASIPPEMRKTFLEAEQLSAVSQVDALSKGNYVFAADNKIRPKEVRRHLERSNIIGYMGDVVILQDQRKGRTADAALQPRLALALQAAELHVKSIEAGNQSAIERDSEIRLADFVEV